MSSFRLRQTGFTLIEVTIVIVILGIVGSIGSSFIVSAMDSYRITEIRQRLTHRAGLTTEQMTRELRMALPNAVRIASSGNCIEFLPIVAGASYVEPLPTPDNGQAKVDSIGTSRFTVGIGTPVFAVVAPFSSEEVYTSAETSAIAAVGTLGASPYTAIPLAVAHRFIRNSIKQRIFLADNPVRFCVSDGVLMRYSDYGLLPLALSDGDPGGTADLMAHGVESIGSAFQLSPGSEDRNTTIIMNLRYSNASQTVDIRHQVGIKNVP